MGLSSSRARPSRRRAWPGLTGDPRADVQRAIAEGRVHGRRDSRGQVPPAGRRRAHPGRPVRPRARSSPSRGAVEILSPGRAPAGDRPSRPGLVVHPAPRHIATGHAGEPAAGDGRRPVSRERARPAGDRPSARRGDLRGHGRGQGRRRPTPPCASCSPATRWTGATWPWCEAASPTRPSRVDAALEPARGPDRGRPGGGRRGPHRVLGEGAPRPRSTLLEARPRTGRTHQIRVHLSSVGHPVLGDRRTAAVATTRPGSGWNGPFLHALVLAFVHPATGGAVEVHDPLPRGSGSAP